MIMSFLLKSIELKNIRAHEYILFEPELEGVTAISGDNGAGKSTIVDAFAWGLYGTRPSGVKNKNLIREGVDPKDKPVSVKSTIIMGGIEYVIERKIINAQGTVECNVWGKQPDKKEFTQVAGPSVSHVEKFLKSELGMNEKGFLTSIFVQQKQVDQIVSATPRERGAVIEDLTGIASITQAISKTNETTRALEKAISIFQVGNIDEVKDRLEKQNKVCQSINENKERAIELFAKAKEDYKKLDEKLKKEKAKVNQRVKLTQQAENLVSQVHFLRKQAEDDLKYIKDFDDKYGTSVHTPSSEYRQSVQDKRAESYGFKSRGTSIKSELIEIEEKLKQCLTLKGSFTSEEEAVDKLAEFTERLKEIDLELEDCRDRKSMLVSELKHSKDSHDHIDGEDKNCPVCKSPIENPEDLRNQIEIEISEFKVQQKENNDKINSLTKEKKLVKENIENTKVAIESINKELVLNTKKEERLSELKILKENNAIVEDELKVLDIKYDEALKIESDKNALVSAKERSLTVNTRINDNNNTIKEIEAEMIALEALSDEELASLDSKADKLKDNVSSLSIAGRDLVGRSKLELERLSDIEDRLKEVEQAVEKYEEISSQIDVSSSASTMLAAFKADRIENAIPTLEFYASDFLSKFTGGEFTKLSMDDKFNTYVTTSKGQVRPVAQLSGGELSSTAIALRLGISMLLNNSDNNVLILDEVLVSMDEDRSRQIMETIGSMTNSQIIFIAHNTDINSVADKTFLVSKAQTI